MPRAIDVGAVPMQVGAVLVLAPSAGVDEAEVRDALEARTRAVPRLRQRLVDTPIGCGRPVWVDDDRFAIGHHVNTRRCPAPGDEAALLDQAADLVTERPSEEHSPWAVTFVTGLASGGSALVAVFHHVLADGLGGLAVLAGLVDGAPGVEVPTGFPRPRPRSRALFVEAWSARGHALAQLPAGVRDLRAAVSELRGEERPHARRTSLNQPTGPGRALAVARVGLAPVLQVAHAHGATVNDVVLTAVAGALPRTLRRRGEAPVPEFVMTVLVAARRAADVDVLGNEIGVKPVVVPAGGDALNRLVETARRRSRVQPPSAAVTRLLDALFRFAGRLRLFSWFTDRQRMVHTFVTNLRGPTDRLTFLGAEVDEVIPVSAISGNVTVAFAVLSYAGTLTVTLVADPEACPDLGRLRDDLQSELDDLTSATARG